MTMLAMYHHDNIMVVLNGVPSIKWAIIGGFHIFIQRYKSKV